MIFCEFNLNSSGKFETLHNSSAAACLFCVFNFSISGILNYLIARSENLFICHSAHNFPTKSDILPFGLRTVPSFRAMVVKINLMIARLCSARANLMVIATFLLPVSPVLLLASISSTAGEPFDHQSPEYLPSSASQRRVKRMYAVCPPEFQRIGNECYFISSKKENWMEAHFKCVDRDSKLAEPFKFEDKRLRKYLTANAGQIRELRE